MAIAGYGLDPGGHPMNKTKAASTADSKGDGQAIRLSSTWAELTTCFILLIIVSGYLFEAFALPAPYNEKSVGAGEFPIIIGVATLIPIISIIVISLANIIRNVPSETVIISRPIGVSLATAILIVQALLLDKVGLIVGIALFSALLMLAAGERRPVFYIGVPVALALGMHAVFVGVLGVYFS